MHFKTIIVHAQSGADSEPRLKAAASLARRFDGALIGVGAVAFTLLPDIGYGYTSAEVFQALLDQIKDDLKRAQAVFTDCVGAGVDATWRESMNLPALAVAELAGAADLAVVGRSAGQEQRVFVDGGDLVMRAGIPVLVMPAAVDQVDARHILVAWKNSREARRAVGDALPFLKEARRVVVAAVQEDGDAAALQAELDDVAERLRRHGVTVETHLSPRLELSVPDQLLGMVESQGADLIVAGAYGHSRLREWIFGGVTHRLLHAAPVPVFLSR